MFERYTEKARRAIFFGRYEASEFGRDQIEADLLLLGLAHESPELCEQWLRANYAQLHAIVARLYTADKRVATNVDLPISKECQKVLAYATEEADHLGNTHIGTEHLFLGLIREGGTAAKLLEDQGKTLGFVRAAIMESPRPVGVGGGGRASTRISGLQIRIEAENGESVGEVWWQGRMPRIGEAIRVPDLDGNRPAYRIVDLWWDMNGPKGCLLQPKGILLKVRKEQD